MRISPPALLFACLLPLVGCKDQKKHGAADPEAADRAQELAERHLRDTAASAAAGTAMQFRGMQVYAQAQPGHWAVCGQVSPFADDPALFVPFVTVITIPDKGAAPPAFAQQVGTTPADATRVYQALVAYCYDEGGPANSPVQSVQPIPPVPNALADPSRHASEDAAAATGQAASPTAGGTAATAAAPAPGAAPGQAPGQAQGQAPASGDVTTRQDANLHASPKGPTVQVVTQGTRFHVFATAPGGWYQVGNDAPLGWIHESMLAR